LYLLFCVANINGGKLVRNLENEETPTAETVKPMDIEVAVDPVENTHSVENTDTVTATSTKDDHEAAVKAYDGKGAKVLPILAKLQAKYESMNDQDKSKLLEKADTYRAKFKSAIDKIDDETAKLFGLNRELINKILGLEKVNKAQELDEAVVEIAEETPEENPPNSEDNSQQQTADEQLEDGQGDAPSGGEVNEQQDELPPLPFFGNNDAFLPFSDSMEAVSTILGQQELWSPEDMQRTANMYGGETSESDSTEENYDHLLRDYAKEFMPVPDSFNIADHLAVDHVYIPGEDDHYREWADNVMDMAKSQDRSPESVYQEILGIPDQGFHGGLPFDPYSYGMMDPLMYDPEYLHFLEVQAAQEQQQYLQFLQMQGIDEDVMWPSIQVSSGHGGHTGYNRMIHSDAELHPSYYENYS